jgi:hypothetical protein
MPGPVLHTGATSTCPHGAPLSIVGSSRLMVSGTPAAVLIDQGTVAGCPFMVGNKPQPCLSTKWLAGTTRVIASGQPLLIGPQPPATVLSADQIPAGPPNVSASQTRVVAT